MTVLVTGISGLLGTNLTLLLLEQGYQVKGVVREVKAMPFSDHPRFTMIQSELTGNLETHLNGVDCVIHTAAVTRQDLISYADYYRFNYTETVRLAEAA